MNEYLIEYYNIEPNERFEVVQLRVSDIWSTFLGAEIQVA